MLKACAQWRPLARHLRPGKGWQDRARDAARLHLPAAVQSLPGKTAPDTAGGPRLLKGPRLEGIRQRGRNLAVFGAFAHGAFGVLFVAARRLALAHATIWVLSRLQSLRLCSLALQHLLLLADVALEPGLVAKHPLLHLCIDLLEVREERGHTLRTTYHHKRHCQQHRERAEGRCARRDVGAPRQHASRRGKKKGRETFHLIILREVQQTLTGPGESCGTPHP